MSKPEAPSASSCCTPPTDASRTADMRSTRTTTTLRGPAVVAAPAVDPAASHEPNVERAVTNATGRPTARTRRVLAGRDMRRSVHRDF